MKNLMAVIALSLALVMGCSDDDEKASNVGDGGSSGKKDLGALTGDALVNKFCAFAYKCNYNKAKNYKNEADWLVYCKKISQESLAHPTCPSCAGKKYQEDAMSTIMAMYSQDCAELPNAKAIGNALEDRWKHCKDASNCGPR